MKEKSKERNEALREYGNENYMERKNRKKKQLIKKWWSKIRSYRR